jgi:hypothetical protein
MKEVIAGRTLVKSPPELWAVCSDADALAQHLEVFGEIRITRLEPETTVAWEGDRASGTVRLEPAGWGTKVTVTAATQEVVATPEPVAVEPEPALVEPEPARLDPEPVQRKGFFSRWFGGGHEPAMAEPEAEVPAPEPTVPEPPAAAPSVSEPPLVDALVALEAALDSLGQAHKRPFSR